MRNLLIKLIPNVLLQKCKVGIANFHKITSHLCVKSPFLTVIYFALFNRTYVREQYALLQGNNAYLNRIKSNDKESSNPLLRRNIHRLEKGLIMKPRKAVFALEYIEETQQSFFFAAKRPHHCQQELSWAKYVLAEYYQCVDSDHNEILSRLHTDFKRWIDECDNDKSSDDGSEGTKKKNKNTPYLYADLPSPEVNYQQFLQFIKLRRSTRWFKPVRVCHEKLKQAVDVASQAPSACNRQPYQFYVIDQNPLLEQVSKLAIGSSGFAENIPCIIAVVGDYSNYEHVRDRHVIYIDSSLAAMQFMQALPTLGLSSCPLNWPELKVLDQKLSKILNLNKYQKTIMLIAVGEADESGGIPYSQKKSAEQLISFVQK